MRREDLLPGVLLFLLTVLAGTVLIPMGSLGPPAPSGSTQRFAEESAQRPRETPMFADVDFAPNQTARYNPRDDMPPGNLLYRGPQYSNRPEDVRSVSPVPNRSLPRTVQAVDIADDVASQIRQLRTGTRPLYGDRPIGNLLYYDPPETDQ